MPISEYWAKKRLELDKGTAVTAPAFYLGLLTSLPEAGVAASQEFSGSMKEATATNTAGKGYAAYARLAASGAFWKAPTVGATCEMLSNEIAKFAGLAAGETLKVKAIALLEGSTVGSGNLYYWVPNEFELTELVTPAEAAAGALSITLK